MPTLKRHECRAPVAFHAIMNTRCALREGRTKPGGATVLDNWGFLVFHYPPQWLWMKRIH
jgi:hypothetical protein